MVNNVASQELIDSPADNAFAITPHDTNEVGTYLPRGLYVGTGGTIVGRLYGDDADVTFVNIPDGYIMPARFLFIRATGTTASNIIGLY